MPPDPFRSLLSMEEEKLETLEMMAKKKKHTEMQEHELDFLESLQSKIEKKPKSINNEQIVSEWIQGKSGNIRALLSTVDSVLWPELHLNLDMSKLVTPHQVKQNYLKIISKIHPDKVTSQSKERQELATCVFSELNKAYKEFRAQ